MKNKHSFHIPVMGLGFTVDTPLKVSQFGIDSVISIVDDILLENMRKMYCNKFKIPYNEISNKIEDFRAKRITSYLNLINNLAERKFTEYKNSAIEKGNEIKDYLNKLPDNSNLKYEFNKIKNHNFNLKEIKNWINENFSMGSIDVNIMTKLDKENYFKGEKLSTEYNDAHAALRGFANSDLESSIILSAGMNPRLYSYIEQFDDFFPNENGEIKKKIILKVSDYRSALIQGKFLAKKGIWVSEFRIESGLNCGGHAFATDGFLMGPILSEFKMNKDELIQSVYNVLVPALESKNRTVPNSVLPLTITAQGGVGTADEHKFLLDHYKIDSVGWGTPFLLVPEATTVDDETLNVLLKAKEDDLYLSDISPLGVPFNSVKGNTKDIEKMNLVQKGRPGSSCPEGFLSSNREFTEKSIKKEEFLSILEILNQPITSDCDEQVDIYCVINRVQGMHLGLYKEDNYIKEGDFKDKAGYLCLEQILGRDSAVTFFLTSKSKNYQAMYQKAGIIGHRLYLASSYLNLGCTGIGAYYDDDVLEFLELDNEMILYSLAIGN